MKNFIYLLFLPLIITSCSTDNEFEIDTKAETIEEIANVRLVYNESESNNIEVTTKDIQTRWAAEIKSESGKSVTLSIFEIIASEEDGKRFYFLKAVSEDGTLETGSFLEKIDDRTYMVRGKTCSCSGCPNGCRLTVTGSLCSCSGCPFNEGTCIKTETQTIGEQ